LQKVDALLINSPGINNCEIFRAGIAIQLAHHFVSAEAKKITNPDLEAADILLSGVADSIVALIATGAFGPYVGAK
jgi:hypothetical protein